MNSVFKSKSSNISTNNADHLSSESPSRDSKTSDNGSANGSIGESSVEIAKEAKEKKDRSSWVKTIGIRTLRMRRSTDSRSSRLSLPSFGSLDRKGKKNKSGKAEDIVDVELKEDGKKVPEDSAINEHVKVESKGASAASFTNGSTSIPTTNSIGTPENDRQASGENSDKQDPARFLGEGLTFKGKLIGVLEVSGPRGDRICQEALSELKMAVKAAGEHKQKVTVHVALDGLRIRDEKTGDCLYHHQVHKISFIAQDLTDTRAFGYIFGSPDTGHRFFGIKTEKSASQVVIAMRDLFQVVFDLKKKEIERAKQQLEMQQKFLATRAAETAPPSTSTKPEPKLSIAETYIEGACAFGIPSLNSSNRSAPEVDLLNLEVELTSLQEGLDSIHHNLADSVPFRGSTASISSDPMNPMPKRSSISSTNTNNTTPIPSTFNAINDPFGDSFDPFSEPSASNTTNFGHSSKFSSNSHVMNSSHNSALTSPFTTDPFAQVDPFPKFSIDSEFFNSDPFDSPSGPFSFNFPAEPVPVSTSTTTTVKERKISVERPNSNISINSSPVPASQPSAVSAKTKAEWTASFEDNFVPESEVNSRQNSDPKPDRDVFTDLDPLGTGSIKPFVDRTEFFQEAKNSTKHVINNRISSDGTSRTRTSNVAEISLPSLTNLKSELNVSDTHGKLIDGSAIPNSFSSHFNPSGTSAVDFDTHFKPHPVLSFDVRSESPPNYSPPPPPRILGTSTAPNASSEFIGSNTHVPFILPPTSSSPSTSRLTKKKSPQILKQMTISESNSSHKTLPKTNSRLGKQFTVDITLKDDIPSLSPPPRPPHGATVSVTASGSSTKSLSSLSSALPRPASGSADKSKKMPGTINSLPPEPPPRPVTSCISSSSNHPLNLVSPPPPLPPKKVQPLSNTLSTPISSRQMEGKNVVSNKASLRSISDANDLPLPLPLRKNHGIVDHSNSTSALGAVDRYAIPASLTGQHGSLRRDNGSLHSTSSIGSSNPIIAKLSMEQALSQVASLSLGDLATRLELPVDKLSSFTIQQLAQKLTEMDFENRKNATIVTNKLNSSNTSMRSDLTSKSGFDDDFSTASAPAKFNTHKDTGFDRYAVFRELALEDASGFSMVNTVGSSIEKLNSEDDDEQSQSQTLEKTFTSRESSSERTLQADDYVESIHHDITTASYATALANTMDDVTDINLSDDQDQENGKFPMDDEDDLGTGFIKSEWATFESNFDDQFATTALVKAEDGNDSPWESDDGEKCQPIDTEKNNDPDQFDFKPFEKPPEPTVVIDEIKIQTPRRQIAEREQRSKKQSSPERIRSPPGQFQRQSSGSSRHSERSSGNNGTPGKISDYSDSGRQENHSRRHRRNSKDYDRWEFGREREGSGRFKDRSERDKDGIRCDSRSSYASIPRRHRNGDSEEECKPSNNSTRRSKGRTSGGGGTCRRRSKDYDRDPEIEDDDDDRSFASHHSNYSGPPSRRHKRYPSSKHYPHHHSSRNGRWGDRTGSPERYSNHESDDESVEEEAAVYARKRDREYYARERDYYDRHHRPRPNSGSGSIKRYNRDSPRHSDLYYRRERRGGSSRHKEEELGDSREFSDYSGEEEHNSRGYYGYNSHRRRGKRNHYKERDSNSREARSHYYTNSPSWDSESCPEGEPNSKAEKTRRSTSGKDKGAIDGINERKERYSRDSPPEHSNSKRYGDKESGNGRRYQSELALNSKNIDQPKLSTFNFDDDFGASSLPTETSRSVQNSGVTSPFLEQEKRKHSHASEVSNKDSTEAKNSTSPFEDNFINTSTAKDSISNEKDEKLWRNTTEQLIYTNLEEDNVNQAQTVPDPDENLLSSNSIVDNIVSQPLQSEQNDKTLTSTNETFEEANNGESNVDIFPPVNESKVFSFSGRRLESIKSEEEKSNDDSHSHSHSAGEAAVQMKKSDSFNIFKQRTDDPFADDDFFA